MASLANITCNDHCSVLDKEEEDTVTASEFRGGTRCKVDIPKSKGGKACGIMGYSMNVRTQNMPILVQTKASVKAKLKTCRISVQIRSNLSNMGDLSSFTIIIAIPTTLKGETVKVTRGDQGVWDANKRIVTWKIGHLSHGESYLVSAEAEVSDAVATVLQNNQFNSKVAEDKISCPCLVNCVSEVDQVSDVTMSAVALDGVPATIVQHQTQSYHLIHRVGNIGA